MLSPRAALYSTRVSSSPRVAPKSRPDSARGSGSGTGTTHGAAARALLKTIYSSGQPPAPRVTPGLSSWTYSSVKGSVKGGRIIPGQSLGLLEGHASSPRNSRPGTSTMTPRCTSDHGTEAYRRAYGVVPFRTWTTPEALFSIIDVDGSGSISLGEVRRYFEKASFFDPVKIEELFALLDADGSGSISREEWRRGFYKAGFDGSGGVVGQTPAGFAVLQELVSPSTISNAALVELHLNRPPVRIPRSEERGMTLPQLRQLWAHVSDRCPREGWMNVHGELLEPKTVTMYEVVRYVIKPATVQYRCSYVERCLGDREPIPPTWTVIHWWDDTLLNLLLCIEQHATDRGVSEESSAYWIAAFALNQHDPTSDIKLDKLAREAIPRTIALSVTIGCLVVVDPRGLLFRRLWIFFEAFVASTTKMFGRTKLIDFYTPFLHLSKRRLPLPPTETFAVGLTDGCALIDAGPGPSGGGESVNKVEREGHFPIARIEKVLACSMSEANCSMELDRQSIIKQLEAQGVQHSVVDATVRGRVALACLRRAFDEGGQLLTKCLDAIGASPLTHITVNLNGSKGFNSESAAKLAKSIPSTAVILSVYFNDVPPSVADVFLYEMAEILKGKSDFGPYDGKTPVLQRLCLISNAISAEAGYAFGGALGKPPKLASVDFGLPTPFDDKVANAIVTPRHTEKKLSYYSFDRFAEHPEELNTYGLSLPRKGLTCSDVVLICASASRGAPESLTALNLANNNIQKAGCEVLEQMITLGLLPKLMWLNLSFNPLPDDCKKSLLNAMKENQSGRCRCGFTLTPSHEKGSFDIVPTRQARK